MQSTSSLGQRIEDLFFRNYPQILKHFFSQPLQAGVGYFILVSGLHLSLALIFGGFANTPNVRTLSEDTNYLPWMIILSAAVYYYFLTPTLLGEAFDALCENEVFPSDDVQIRKQVCDYFALKRLRLLPFMLTTVIVLGYSFFIIVIQTNLTYWHELHPISFILATLGFGLGWFAAISVIINIGLATYVTKIILDDYKDQIVVDPLNPDGSGGFNPLGKFSLRFTYVALAVGAMIVISTVDSIRNDRVLTDIPVLLGCVDILS